MINIIVWLLFIIIAICSAIEIMLEHQLIQRLEESQDNRLWAASVAAADFHTAQQKPRLQTAATDLDKVTAAAAAIFQT